jgi:hypothetical protein
MDSPIIYRPQTFDILYFTPRHALLSRLDAPVPLFLGWASASDRFTFRYPPLRPTSPAQYTRQMQVISGNTIYTSHPLPDHYPLVHLTILAHPCTIILCPLHNRYPIVARKLTLSPARLVPQNNIASFVATPSPRPCPPLPRPVPASCACANRTFRVFSVIGLYGPG